MPHAKFKKEKNTLMNKQTTRKEKKNEIPQEIDISRMYT